MHIITVHKMYDGELAATLSSLDITVTSGNSPVAKYL